LSDAINTYVGELQRLLKNKQDEIADRNEEIKEGVFEATADPWQEYVPPHMEVVPPFLNFAPLLNAADELHHSARRYADAVNKDSAIVGGASLDSLNQKLILSERYLTSEEGLPGRPWFKHEIYAPGFYTGYGVKTIPGVREAIEQKQWQLAEEQIKVVANILEKESSLIDSAAGELEKMEKR
jgi:N-acetylated-alpha-linked acidic dipeptidase